MYIRNLLLFFFIFLSGFFLAGQDAHLINIGGPQFISKSSTLPEGITSTRSAVVIKVPDRTEENFGIRGDWKSLAEIVHKKFRQIGVDPVTYIYLDDFNAGPEVGLAYYQLLQTRRVQNLIFIRKAGSLPDESYTMQVIPLTEEGKILHGQLSWIETSNELDRLFLRLGRQVLRQELKRSNFLIPEVPEYLEDLSVFKGNRLENYPSRVKSLPIAVVPFQKANIKNIQDSTLQAKIKEYNLQVAHKNEALKKIMQLYPFKFEMVDEPDDDVLYQRGYQYALMPLITTGKTAKKLLNYKTNASETDYMATVFDQEGNQQLMKIPVDANICKYYIKQTIVKDIHTGDHWDTGLTWQESLQNFILHLRDAFNLPLDPN